MTTVQNGTVPAADYASDGDIPDRAGGSATVPEDRLRHRYPRRRTRWVLIATAAVVAVVGLGWLGWAAWQHSHPAVGGQISVWKVPSDHKVSFTLTVDRRDPKAAAACRVIAQASNHETVGERRIHVSESADSVVHLRQTMRTLHQAASVSLDRCWTTS